jgi:RNA polymerase sigma-70 factor (ECF subfamily)
VGLGWAELTRPGSEKVFAALVAKHQSKVRNFLNKLCGTYADADDLAQEAFLVAWKKRHLIRDIDSFSSFVCGIGYRIAANAQRSFWRRNQRNHAWYELTRTINVPENETRLSLEKALKTLPLDQRACVILCMALNFSHSEAAETLKLPLGTVKSYLQRARQKLNTMIGLRDE